MELSVLSVVPAPGTQSPGTAGQALAQADCPGGDGGLMLCSVLSCGCPVCWTAVHSSRGGVCYIPLLFLVPVTIKRL